MKAVDEIVHGGGDGHVLDFLQYLVDVLGNPLGLQKFIFQMLPVTHGVYQCAVHIKNAVSLVHGMPPFSLFYNGIMHPKTYKSKCVQN